MNTTETPFFIVGNPRSGTTLLRYMISSHYRLFIPSETGFLPYLGIEPKKKLSKSEVDHLLNKIGSINREWSNLVPNLDVFYENLLETTLPFFLDALYRIKISPFNATRWGDKTPMYIRYIPELHQIFPQALFIHVIRDGRDTCLSAEEKWAQQNFYMDKIYLLKSWAEHIKLGQTAKKHLKPDQYIEVFYEMLVSQPYETLKSICQFLGEEFDPTMLDHTQLAKKTIGNLGHIEVRKDLNEKSVNRWKMQMSVFEKKMADVLVGSTLDQLGYQQSNLGSFTLKERIKFLIFFNKYRIINFVRKALIRSGFLRINRRKRQI